MKYINRLPSLLLVMPGRVTEQPCDLFRPEPAIRPDEGSWQEDGSRQGILLEHRQGVHIVFQPAIVEGHHTISLFSVPGLLRPEVQEFSKRDHREILLDKLHLHRKCLWRHVHPRLYVFGIQPCLRYDTMIGQD